LAERIGLPVFADNVCNVLARGERWFGASGFVDDLCVVFVGPGIGLSQYVAGSLHRGAHGRNAEFGHVKPALAARRPVCVAGAVASSRQLDGCAGAKANALFGQSFDPMSQFVEAFDFIVTQEQEGREQARLLLHALQRRLVLPWQTM
jgi:predicted NBD/HSP70 family sugar kinase